MKERNVKKGDGPLRPSSISPLTPGISPTPHPTRGDSWRGLETFLVALPGWVGGCS